MNKIIITAVLLTCISLNIESTFAESTMYKAPAAEIKAGQSKIIRTVEDARQDREEYNSGDDMHARPIFEELNKEINDQDNSKYTAPVKTKPELLRPFEKK